MLIYTSHRRFALSVCIYLCWSSEHGAIESKPKKKYTQQQQHYQENKIEDSQYAHFDWWFAACSHSSNTKTMKRTSPTHRQAKTLCERTNSIIVYIACAVLRTAVWVRNSVCNYSARSRCVLPYWILCHCSCATVLNAHTDTESEKRPSICMWANKRQLSNGERARATAWTAWNGKSSDDSANIFGLLCVAAVHVCKNFSIRHGPSVSVSAMLWVHTWAFQCETSKSSLDVSRN